MSKNTQINWVYKCSIRDAEIFFETGKFKYGKRAAVQFATQYNELFNKSEINSVFNKSIDSLRLINKINELRIIYSALLYADGKNAKKRFNEIFGREYTGVKEDFEAINHKIEFFADKLKPLTKEEKKDGLTFPELIAIVENSRAIQIDREMKVFEFHRVYELELKKWKNAK